MVRSAVRWDALGLWGGLRVGHERVGGDAREGQARLAWPCLGAVGVAGKHGWAMRGVLLANPGATSY